MKLKIAQKLNSQLLVVFFIALTLSFVILSTFFTKSVFAQTSSTINLQGRIVRNDTGNEGLNVSAGNPACVFLGAANDTCDFRVRFYTVDTAGTLLGTETFSNYEIGEFNGIFNLPIGAGTYTAGTETSIRNIILKNSSVYAEIDFAPDGSTFTETFLNADGKRMAIRAVPYAISAQGSNQQFQFHVANDHTGYSNISAGQIYFDGDDNVLRVYDGTDWLAIQAMAGSIPAYWQLNTATTPDILYSYTGLDVALGGTTSTAPFFFDVSAEMLALTNTTSGDSFRVNDQASDSTPFVINASGSVGIGTTSPTYKTEIVDTSGGTTLSLLQIKNNSTSTNTGSTLRFVNDTTSNTTGAGLAYLTSKRLAGGATDFDMQTYNGTTMGSRIYIDGTGNVGLGATTLNANFVSNGRTNRFSNQYPEYRWRYINGTDLDWRKIADISLGTGSYRAASLQVDVINANTNYGHTANAIPMRYYVSAFRSGAVEDDSDTGSVSGPYADYVRLVKTSIGVYELQVRSNTNYKHLEFITRVISELGSTVTYQDSPTAGSVAGTIYTATPTHTDTFSNAYVAGNLGVGTANSTVTWVGIAAATSSRSQMRFTSSGGVNPSSPSNGDLWWNGTNLYFFDGSSSVDILAGGSGGGSLFTDGGAITYLTSVTDNFSLGGSSSSSPFYYDVTNNLLTLTNTTGGLSFRINDEASDTTPFVIDASGNVGIGTLTPGAKLDIAGAASLISNTSGDITINPSSGLLSLSGSSLSNVLNANLSGNLIVNGGSVGIGTTSTAYTLSVDGNGLWIDNPLNIGRTQISTIGNSANNGYVRGSIIMSRDADISFDGTNWQKTGGSSTDWTAIISRSAGLGLYAGPADTFVDMSNSTFASTYERMTILLSGNIGIGDTTPDTKLKVVGALCVKSDGTNCAGNTAGTIYANNTSVQSADLAESYKTSDMSIGNGDILSVIPDGFGEVIKANINNSSNLIGAVSTSPGITMNATSGETYRPVGLVGKLPVKVFKHINNIDYGDPIAASTVNGIGYSENDKTQTIVGRALETTYDWDSTNCPVVASINSIPWPADTGDNPMKPCFEVPVSSFTLTTRNALLNTYGITDSETIFVGKIMAYVNPTFYQPDWISNELANIVNDYNAGSLGGSGYWNMDSGTTLTTSYDVNGNSFNGNYGRFAILNGGIMNLSDGNFVVDSMGNTNIAGDMVLSGALKGGNGNILAMLGDSLGNTAFEIKNDTGETVFKVDSLGVVAGKGVYRSGWLLVPANGDTILNHNLNISPSNITLVVSNNSNGNNFTTKGVGSDFYYENIDDNNMRLVNDTGSNVYIRTTLYK